MDRGFTSYSVNEVYVYIDDLEALANKLRYYGDIEIVANHKGEAESIVDDLFDLVGRNDIHSVSVTVRDPSDIRLGGPNKLASVKVPDINGMEIHIDHEYPELRKILDHFVQTLEPATRPRWRRHQEPLFGNAKLTLDTRKSKWQEVRRKRHEVKLALLSGVGGAVAGAALTSILTALLTG